MKKELARTPTGRADRLPISRRSSLFTPWFEDYFEPTRWFDEFLGRDFLPLTAGEGFLAPAIDIEETSDEYLVSTDLPGVKKEDINIECSGNQLMISAERKYETVEGRKQDRRERFYGSYCRSFTLPAGSDPEKIEAAFENGVLTVHVHKGEQAKAKRIQIGEKKKVTEDRTQERTEKH